MLNLTNKQERFLLSNPNIFEIFSKYHQLGRDDFFQLFTEDADDFISIKSEYLDFLTGVSEKRSIVSFITSGVYGLNRGYKESYIISTPYYNSLMEVINLFNQFVPKVRDRNSTVSKIVPIIDNICAKYLILRAFIECTFVNSCKEIFFTIDNHSIKVEYTHNSSLLNNTIIDTRKDYFYVLGFNYDVIEELMTKYLKENDMYLRSAFFNGRMTFQIIYNKANSHLRKTNIDVKGRILSIDDYNIYKLISQRSEVSINVIAETFGYHSIRAAKYHVDKLINYGLVKQNGEQGSQLCTYSVTD